MTDNKKKWVKPELIILVRSNPAEAVFTDPADNVQPLCR